jgi:hypothetical protein
MAATIRPRAEAVQGAVAVKAVAAIVKVAKAAEAAPVAILDSA